MTSKQSHIIYRVGHKMLQTNISEIKEYTTKCFLIVNNKNNKKLIIKVYTACVMFGIKEMKACSGLK